VSSTRGRSNVIERTRGMVSRMVLQHACSRLNIVCASRGASLKSPAVKAIPFAAASRSPTSPPSPCFGTSLDSACPLCFPGNARCHFHQMIRNWSCLEPVWSAILTSLSTTVIPWLRSFAVDRLRPRSRRNSMVVFLSGTMGNCFGVRAMCGVFTKNAGKTGPLLSGRTMTPKQYPIK
jgi:hypothetical protein